MNKVYTLSKSEQRKIGVEFGKKIGKWLVRVYNSKKTVTTLCFCDTEAEANEIFNKWCKENLK